MRRRSARRPRARRRSGTDRLVLARALAARGGRQRAARARRARRTLDAMAAAGAATSSRRSGRSSRASPSERASRNGRPACRRRWSGSRQLNPGARSLQAGALQARGLAGRRRAGVAGRRGDLLRATRPRARAGTRAGGCGRRHRGDRARRCSRDARETYERSGATRDLARVDAARGARSACATASAAARRRPATGWEALTDTELKVVRLVAERLTNPEIAERMFISRRTVQTHVSHALAKLGVDSRRDARRRGRPPRGLALPASKASARRRSRPSQPSKRPRRPAVDATTPDGGGPGCDAELDPHTRSFGPPAKEDIRHRGGAGGRDGRCTLGARCACNRLLFRSVPRLP